MKTYQEIIKEALELVGGWREAIALAEDYTGNSVVLKNMQAALDQLDDWTIQAREALRIGRAAQTDINGNLVNAARDAITVLQIALDGVKKE